MPTPKIDSYRFGKIVIDGEAHTKDVIILPDRVIGNWWRQEGHRLHPDDLEPVLESAPQVLVVGKGATGRMKIAPQTEDRLDEAGIKLIARASGQAVETYNQLRQEKRVAAALHLTC